MKKINFKKILIILVIAIFFFSFQKIGVVRAAYSPLFSATYNGTNPVPLIIADGKAGAGNLLQLKNNTNLNAFLVDYLGNTGIGTSTPAAALDVQNGLGHSILAGSMKIGNVATPVDDTDAANKAYVDGLTGADTDWTISGSDMYSGVSGNVGIGTNSPAYKLDIVGKLGLNDGGNSVFIGTGAGANDDGTANGNIGIGYQSLYLNTTGNYNIASGYYSLYSNIDGAKNIATGFASLRYNSSGDENTASGYTSLRNNTSGRRNTGIGSGSLYSNTTGNENTSIGQESLYSNTTGSYNVAIGRYAGRYIEGNGANSSGNYNLFLGYSTKALADNDQNEIVIGYNTTGVGSNSVVLGNDSITKTILKGSIGIGTSTPAAALDVQSGSGHSILAGSMKIGNVATPVDDTDAANKAYVDGLTGADTDWTISGSNMYSGVSGNVGIGTNSPAYKLDIVGKLGLNDGGNSVFIGTGAGANDDGTTNANASIGYNSLNANTTGIGNVVLGATALSKNITGDYNVVLGYGAANYTTTFVNNESSSQSIFIGAITNPLAAGGQNEIIIGHDANGLGSNSVVLGNDSITKTVLKGSIGIGTTNPDSANLEIYDTSGYALYANGLTIGGVGTPSADDDAANKAYVDGLTGADTDWTISGSDMYSGVSGNVGIGTNSPVGKLHIKGADYPLAIFERTGATADVGYGNSRYLAVKTTDMSDGFGGGIIFSIQDNASAIEDIAKIYALRDGADNEGALIFRAGTSGDEEFMRISSTGNIGIGTTNPSYDLDISGNFRVTNSAYFDRTTYIKDANGTIDSWWGWYAWDKQFQFNKRSSANVFVQNIWAADWDTGDLMLVPTAGSVGVGESSLNSQTKVDINGSSTYGLLVNSDRIGEIGSVVEDTDAVNKAYVDDNFMPIGTSSGWALGGNDLTAKDYIGSNTNYDIGFETNNIERMTIDTDGNVGIGTSSPEGKLNVKSSEWPVVNIERTTTTGTTGFFSGMRLRTTTSASMADNFGGSFIFELNDTDTTGQNIVGRFGAVRHGADNSGSLVFQTTLNGTENERMRILSTGNVGIGTNNPTSLLTIANDNWISSINSAGTGGVNMFKVNSSDQIEVGSSLLIGPLEFAADSGMISFIDMPVTSSATSGTDEGYSFKIDGNNILTVFAESDGAGGITNSGVGIGTSAPTVALDVQLGSGHSILAGSMKIGNVATPVDGTDAVNKTYVDDAVSGASGSDTDWTESGSDIYRSSGNVGIGTTVPGKKLHINVTGDGDGVYINNSQTGQTAASAGFQLINDLGGQGAFVKIYSSNNTTNSALNNQLYVKNSIGGMSWVANTGSSIGFGIGTSISSANDLVIDSSGDVGIGTTDPSHNLVVYSSDQYTRTQINNSNSSGYAEILFENSGVATPSSWALRSEPSGKLAVIDYDNSLNPFAIERNTPSNTLYLDSTARIGVGTSTPEAGIHLVSSQSNEGLILQTTESTQGRIGFDLKTGYTSNVDDFFRFNFRGDLGDVILTTYDDSSDTWRQFLDFNYLDDDLFFGTNQKVTIKSSGNVGIGTTTPSEMLTVNGNVEADAYYYSSDERLKKNIETIDGAIETIKKLNPVSFNWRENDIASQGFIAQELEQVIPELVKTNSVNGLKAVQYANLTAVLTAGIQEQQKEIDYLKTMVEILKLRVNELESK